MNFCFKLLQELFMEPLRSYIKHSKECFIQFPNLQNKAVPRFLKPSSHCLESGWNNSSCLIITVCWPQGYVSQDDQQQVERWKKKRAVLSKWVIACTLYVYFSFNWSSWGTLKQTRNACHLHTKSKNSSWKINWHTLFHLDSFKNYRPPVEVMHVYKLLCLGFLCDATAFCRLS